MPSLPFLLPLPIEIKDKVTNMKCPKCNNEVNEQEKNCPNCNSPLNNNDKKNDPTLSRGLVVFIIIGTIFLVAFGFYYYGQHKNDPEYTQTAIEPDSNLADNQEEEQAEKVFNSIRRSNRTSHKSSHEESSSSNSDRQSSSPEHSSSSAGEIQPIAPAASKPRIESIEMD